MSLWVNSRFEFIFQLLVTIFQWTLWSFLALDLLQPLKLVLASLLLKGLLPLPTPLDHHIVVLVNLCFSQGNRYALQFQFVVVTVRFGNPIHSEHVLLSVSLSIGPRMGV